MLQLLRDLRELIKKEKGEISDAEDFNIFFFRINYAERGVSLIIYYLTELKN